jgi:hypothetical protein
VIGEYNRDILAGAVDQRQASAEERMVDVHHVHALQEFLRDGSVSQRNVKARVG